MDKMLSQLVALNRCARNGDYIHESWGTREFVATYAAAVEACKPHGLDSTMGTCIDWSPQSPEHLAVTRRGIISERVEFSHYLPLEGALARTLMQDLQAIATQVVVKQIREERDAALVREAEARIYEMLRAA